MAQQHLVIEDELLKGSSLYGHEHRPMAERLRENDSAYVSGPHRRTIPKGYIDDEDFGPVFIKICSYALWGIKVCINGTKNGG